MISDELEKSTWDKNNLLCGVDETGMGCIAGSCYVGMVIFPKGYDFQKKLGTVNDSKKLKEDARNQLASIIKEEALLWYVEKATASQIDNGSAYHIRFDIASNMIARAYLEHQNIAVCMDGNKLIPRVNNAIENKCLVKGDTKSFTIAAASIVAKCEKDKEMRSLHEKYPEYNFASNKGYASKEHRNALKKFGLCPEHRKTFCTRFEVKEI